MIYKKSWKYILVKDNFFKKFYRPKALKDFPNVTKGDIGGYLEGYYNLSQSGNCWIYDEAIVMKNAKVSGNAKISGKAKIDDNAKVYGNAIIYQHPYISENVQVYGDAIVSGWALIYGNATIQGDAKISGNRVLTEGVYK